RAATRSGSPPPGIRQSTEVTGVSCACRASANNGRPMLTADTRSGSSIRVDGAGPAFISDLRSGCRGNLRGDARRYLPRGPDQVRLGPPQPGAPAGGHHLEIAGGGGPRGSHPLHLARGRAALRGPGQHDPARIQHLPQLLVSEAERSAEDLRGSGIEHRRVDVNPAHAAVAGVPDGPADDVIGTAVVDAARLREVLG